MILVIDSGSTKTHWCFISDKAEIITTGGMNPYFRTQAGILEELNADLKPRIPDNVEKIFFYGAGITNGSAGKAVENILAVLFPGSAVETHSDLLGAARATLHNRRGIACILGTGSNSCLYNGEKIILNIPPLGFILGDEGSGAALGKKLLADYLKAIMPRHIAQRFESRFAFRYPEILQKVYRQEQPGRFLASLTPFIHENLADEYCRSLCRSSFTEFIERNIMQYPGSHSEPIYLTGSVACHFSGILNEIFREKSLNLVATVKDPIGGLIHYHTGNPQPIVINS